MSEPTAIEVCLQNNLILHSCVLVCISLSTCFCKQKNSFRVEDEDPDTEKLRKRYKSTQLSSGYFSRSESEEDKEQKSEHEGGSVDTEGLSQSSGYNSSDSNVVDCKL